MARDQKTAHQWQTNAATLEQERAALEFQREELKRLDFQLESWQELISGHSRLNHAASLIEGVQAAQHALDESDEALLPQIHAVAKRLKSLSEFDPELKSVIDVLEPAALQLQESVYALRHYARRLDIDPVGSKKLSCVWKPCKTWRANIACARRK